MSLTAQHATVVYVNDQPRAWSPELTVGDLAAELGMAERKGVAIAVNGSVVARAGWAMRRMKAGDRVLVIRATQGG